mmetsp:Transcript_17831/g.30246  ORF Transcript_17831/g.30246 Transcript_17831/m.30246 type:complete len:301 (+) Transcript_17831:39-941(+)
MGEGCHPSRSVTLCDGASAVHVPVLALEVDVAVVAGDGASLVGRLRHARGLGEGVGAGGGGEVEVLPLEVVGPERNWLLLGVVGLGQPLLDLLVLDFLRSSPGAVLDDQLFVLLVETHSLPVLRLHDSPSDGVLEVGVGGDVLGDLHVLLAALAVEGVVTGGVEEALLGEQLLLPLHLVHLLVDLAHYLRLLDLRLLADLGDAGGRVDIHVLVLLVELGLLPLPIDSIRGVVEHLVRRQRLLEVEVSLGNMLLHNRAAHARELPQRPLLCPVANEGAVASPLEFVEGGLGVTGHFQIFKN